MPDGGCELVAERLGAGKIRKPGCVVAQFLVEKIVEVVGLNQVADVRVLGFAHKAVLKCGEGFLSFFCGFGIFLEGNGRVLAHQGNGGFSVGVVF